MEKVGNLAVIGLSNAQSLAQTCSNLLSHLSSNKNTYQSLKTRFTNQLLYADELFSIALSQKSDTEILQKIIEVIGLLLKAFKANFHSIFSTLFKNYFGDILYREDACQQEILYAICVFDDLIEYTGDLLSSNNGSPLIQKLIEFCYHPNKNIRQSAAYGLGLAAQKGNPQIFTPYKEQAVVALEYILNLQQAGCEFIVSSECAAGAIGKIGIKFDLGLLPCWMAWLPFKSDPEEARQAHKIFIENIGVVIQWKERTFQILGQLGGGPVEYLDQSSWASLPVLMSHLNNQ